MKRLSNDFFQFPEKPYTDDALDAFMRDYAQNNINEFFQIWQEGLSVDVPRPGLEFIMRHSVYQHPMARYEHETNTVQVYLTDGTGVVARQITKARRSPEALESWFQDILYHEFGHHWRCLTAKKLDSKLQWGVGDTWGDAFHPQLHVLYASIDEGIAESLKVLALGQTHSHHYAEATDGFFDRIIEDWECEPGNYGCPWRYTHPIGYRLVWPIVEQHGLRGAEYILTHLPTREDIPDLASYRQRIITELDS
jgi:hypothetical protein